MSENETLPGTCPWAVWCGRDGVTECRHPSNKDGVFCNPLNHCPVGEIVAAARALVRATRHFETTGTEYPCYCDRYYDPECGHQTQCKEMNAASELLRKAGL